MKKLSLILAFIFTTIGFSQGKYLTKTGIVIFEASVPAFEEVKATNANTTAILNTENGEFAALVLVKGFRFKNALMEEHFNENYADSDDFPKATFKGTISDFSINDITINNNKKIYNGSLSFHGKTKTLTDESLIISKNSDGMIIIKGILNVSVSDFGIKIPKVVSNKLSEEVDVQFEFQLTKK
jgi:polyisoprenoid-binding protein YceI